ncbi:AfsR/SARP family transcriptional regulator [Streptomyces iconiensis]|uniref:AfsR/SARP family transcriptional regulator n=1 Tax=Streptomyces iconiensis TaxID=1384038 RepID=A0ABT7A384_9ACTN|nr:AfsR/SARP family transcriptional regulator [Streptomyces iconiensis]MDJ1135798.1 AfsR/SARP family transcriptional regulator [Streptomyces iconiensis]
MHEINGTAKRLVLQALLVSEGNAVPHGALIEEIWGEGIPDGVANALQAHISRIRRWLREISGNSSGTQLVSSPHGYQLVLGEAELDASVFQETVGAATALRGEDPSKAALLRSALSMWRGPPFGGSDGGPLSDASAIRYDEVRLRAQEELFDTELKLGRHAQVLSEIRQAQVENPTREHFCAQLMFALYRSGRQAEALGAYHATRECLNEDLGIDPTPELRKLEQCILRQSPELAPTEPELPLPLPLRAQR